MSHDGFQLIRGIELNIVYAQLRTSVNYGSCFLWLCLTAAYETAAESGRCDAFYAFKGFCIVAGTGKTML